MFKKLFSLIFAFLSIATLTEAKICLPLINCSPCVSQVPCPKIRILVINDEQSAELGVCGQYSLYDPNRCASSCKDKYLSTRFRGKCRCIEALACGLKWGEEFPDLYQLKIVDDKPESYSIVNGIPYKGPLYIYDIGGTISIVNEVIIEEYVRSIISGFAEQCLEFETLCALAIIARTNAYWYANHAKSQYWDIEAKSVNYQGFVNASAEVYQAVYDTQHMALSLTGIYRGNATPFLSQFKEAEMANNIKDYNDAKISLQQANEMARQGAHAAQILAKAYPGASIVLIN